MKFKIVKEYDFSENKPSQHAWFEARPYGALGIDWFVNIETIEDLEAIVEEHPEADGGLDIQFGLHPQIVIQQWDLEDFT